MTASQYWTFVKLSANSQRRTTELPQVKAWFQQQFPDLLPCAAIDHRALQRQLVQLQQSDPTAALCLRCFISQQIVQVCLQLVQQFGDYYGFTGADLLPLVLTDEGSLHPQHESLAVKILRSFDPDRASLTTWTLRLVKQDHDLDRFLLECGLCMLSDWALLNDASASKLERVLAQFHLLSTQEVQQAQLLLAAYHAVYRRDRILQRQRGACVPPTIAQLQAMSQWLQDQTRAVESGDRIRTRLQILADRLRQHRIATRSAARSVPLPDPEQLAAPPTDPPDDDRSEFLAGYRQQFCTCLDRALAASVRDRIQRLKPPKDQAFVTALRLFHCQGVAMGAIAAAVGLQAQYQVTRLLNLKAWRADVRHALLQCLQATVREVALPYVSLDRLEQLDQQIEAALSEQIDQLLAAEQANANTPKSHATQSLFARSLCRYLATDFATDLDPD